MAKQDDSTTRTKIGDAINSAVAMSEAETDQVVSAVLDAMKTKDANGGNYDHVIDLQIQLEEIEGVASLAYESCDEAPFAGVLGMIERRIKAVRYELSDLIGSSPKPTLNGFNSEVRFSRKAMVLDLCRGIRESVQPFINNDEVPVDMGVKLVGVEMAAGTIESMVSESPERKEPVSVDAATAVDVAFDRFQIEWADKSMAECADRLRQFTFDMSEILTADPNEDGYSVTKTWTRKGIRYFVAEREFLQSLLPKD